MIVIGIETSCDETACRIVRDGREVLSTVVASQIETHQKFGGVVPEVAAREHLAQVDKAVAAALSESGLATGDIDAVAVTRGPGLIGALLVGVSYAKGLALGIGKPLVPVDHIYAHLHGALLGVAESKIEFPVFGLVVSGGHTNLYLMHTLTDFELIAQSIDDACGESFDKVAKLLGLSYPGGPAIETLAKAGKASSVAMPHMLEDSSKLMFSYSGLKTHVVNLVNRQPAIMSDSQRADIAAAFQEEALGQIVRKLKLALTRYPQVGTLIIAGGVAANQRFRELVAESVSIRTLFAPLPYCSDNGAMIAASGFHFLHKGSWASDWDAYSRHQC